jgi:hypothetical protein
MGDGVSLTSAEHPYTVRGFDAWGNEVSETIEVSPTRPSHPIRYFLMRHTPCWAWNIWYRLGYTKMRMITKVVLDVNESSLETAEIDILERYQRPS